MKSYIYAFIALLAAFLGFTACPAQAIEVYSSTHTDFQSSVSPDQSVEIFFTDSGSILLAQRAPMGGNGRPMRATMYGWQTNNIPNYNVPAPPRPPVGDRGYWNNYYVYGPGWAGGTSYPDNLPGASVNYNTRPDPRQYDDRKPPTVEEQAAKTVYSFMGSLKYGDFNGALSYLPDSLRSSGTGSSSVKYIADRTGKVKDSRVLSTKLLSGNSVQVRTQYLYNDGSGNWIPETRTFTVSNGMIVNPL